MQFVDDTGRTMVLVSIHKRTCLKSRLFGERTRMRRQEVGFVGSIQWQHGSAPRGAIRLIISPERLVFRPSTRLVEILTLGMIPILEIPLSTVTVAAPVRKVWGLPISAVRFQVVDFKRPILFGTKEVEGILALLEDYGVTVDWHPPPVPYRML